MTLLQKKPLYNFISLINLFFFIIIASFLAALGKLKFPILLLVLCGFLIIFFLLRARRLHLLRVFHGETDKLEEKNNLLLESIKEKKKILDSLPAKAQRVSSLFNVSCDFIELIEPQAILDFLVNTTVSLFPAADNVLLFLLNNNSLNLARSAKREGTIITEKQGDAMEKWVIKHTQSLVIEDLTKDFRFDYNKVTAFKERKVRSCIVSPLAIGENILGAMRVESRAASHFSLDDSRLLRSICDLGAVVLERAELFHKAEELAIKDSLTSLFLRQYFFSRLKEEAKRAHAKKTGIGLIMLDIDDFKEINDAHGHTVGDLVLKKLAQILTDTAGDAGNLICRFGGEEFILFLVECNREHLHATAEKIRTNILNTVVSFRRKDVRFTVSIGAALYPDDNNDVLDLIGIVDQLLYKAKKQGKNRICYFG